MISKREGLPLVAEFAWLPRVADVPNAVVMSRLQTTLFQLDTKLKEDPRGVAVDLVVGSTAVTTLRPLFTSDARLYQAITESYGGVYTQLISP